MDSKKIKKGIKIVLCALAVLAINSYGAKADTISSSKQGVVLRSTNLTSNKVIKVPKKVETKVASGSSKGANVALSRGASQTAASMISYAYQYLGRPYVFGAAGPKAFDCSGFTAYVFRPYGFNLPHYTGSQFQMGQSISRANLQPGDLVFFNTYGPISHVGIYIGGGEFIHAASGSKNVTVSDLSESYYANRYAGARRILK